MDPTTAQSSLHLDYSPTKINTLHHAPRPILSCYLPELLRSILSDGARAFGDTDGMGLRLRGLLSPDVDPLHAGW